MFPLPFPTLVKKLAQPTHQEKKEKTKLRFFFKLKKKEAREKKPKKPKKLLEVELAIKKIVAKRFFTPTQQNGGGRINLKRNKTKFKKTPNLHSKEAIKHKTRR